jgi:hypothetical protein
VCVCVARICVSYVRECAVCVPCVCVCVCGYLSSLCASCVCVCTSSSRPITAFTSAETARACKMEGRRERGRKTEGEREGGREGDTSGRERELLGGGRR